MKRLMSFSRATVVCALRTILPSLAFDCEAEIVGFGDGSGWHLNVGGLEPPLIFPGNN